MHHHFSNKNDGSTPNIISNYVQVVIQEMGNAPRVGTPIDEQSPLQLQASESLQQGEEVVLRFIREKRPTFHKIKWYTY